ncbi:OmpA family protein [Mucisphaera calidilacus]|uniref:Putative lipoprotein YiaD n=1 Tax=Mucisphaera calidilacus TaxID=2527982 RepID=A0A518BV71_9BACT|nr:OmpA family protein [Mucisphaera calidilacus]QDU70869.1 putative lipoprotein YiaD precursor [Mucisphaera calidilacus]
MKRLLLGSVMITSLFLFGGCAAQQRADELEAMNKQAEAQIIDLKQRLEEAEATIQTMRDAPPPKDPVLLLELQGLREERARLQAELAQAQAELREAGVVVALPERLDRALMELAEANSDLMAYDQDMALIRFKSDLTFPPGSAEVSPQAASSIARLAAVLSRSEAEQYEVRILGHTDSVPISNPGTREKHPTNWHLSVHRAIGVKNALEKAGVPASRIGVAGYGPYRPLEENAADGSAANRRVEIMLVPISETPGTPTELGASQASSSSNASATPPPAEPADPNTRVRRPLITK